MFVEEKKFFFLNLFIRIGETLFVCRQGPAA